MKRGFSLIEILQTVILIGIIAGLSVSFFKRINTDTKLLNSTVVALDQAVQEVNRRICSDDTPVCDGANAKLCHSHTTFEDCNEANENCYYANNVDTNADGVIDVVAASEFNPQTGLCEYEIDPDNPATLCLSDFMEKNVDGTRVCYRDLICSDNLPAVPRSSRICPNGVPNYEGSDVIATEFCKQIRDLINHKEQLGPLPTDDDFVNTCIRRVDCLESLNTADTADDAEIFGNPSSCRDELSDVDVRPNMVLPNGVRLYNLSGEFKDGKLKILIKYDKSDDLRNINDRNTAIYEVSLPLAPQPAP